MALPNVSMRQLLDAGVHFGHQTHRWNPKMAPFIYGSRNNIHIIDLTQTVPLFHQALLAVADTVAKGGRVLFVGTKRQASEAVAEAARSCAHLRCSHGGHRGRVRRVRDAPGALRWLRVHDCDRCGSGRAGLACGWQSPRLPQGDRLGVNQSHLSCRHPLDTLLRATTRAAVIVDTEGVRVAP